MGNLTLIQSRLFWKSSALEADGGFGPTAFQEPARVNRPGVQVGLPSQSAENEFQSLIDRVERVSHPQERRIQLGPTLKVDSRFEIRGRGGEICVECDLADVSGGDCLENWLDPMTRLPELDKTELNLFQTSARG
jgi:hypothetical protein